LEQQVVEDSPSCSKLVTLSFLAQRKRVTIREFWLAAARRIGAKEVPFDKILEIMSSLVSTFVVVSRLLCLNYLIL
jgi:hypothetical protein